MTARRPITTEKRGYAGSVEDINRQPPANDQLWSDDEVNDHKDTLNDHADRIDSTNTAVSGLATQLGVDYEALLAIIGVVAGLDSTAINLVSAINESVQIARSKAAINDEDNASGSTWSSSKITSEISSSLSSLATGAPDLLNSINELSNALEDNPDVLVAIRQLIAENENTISELGTYSEQFFGDVSENFREIREQLTAKPQILSSIAALKDHTASVSTIAIVNHEHQGGTFRWTSRDVEDQVAVDTLDMFYVSRSVQNGSSGAWVRVWAGDILSSWAGLTSDWSVVIEAASIASELYPGRVMVLEDKTYTKTRNVSGKLNNVCLKSISKGSATVRQDYESSQNIVEFGDNSSLQGLVVDANSMNTGQAVGGTSCENVVLSSVEVKGWRGGVEFFSALNTGPCKNITLTDVLIHEPGDNGQVYPCRFNAPWGTEKIDSVYLDDVVVIGSLGAYSSTTTAGTADQISFQNCNKVRMNRCVSANGGEIGVNFSRDTTDVIVDDLLVFGCDADGINIGSGQIIVEVDDIAGFQVDNINGAVTINGDVTGRIETIEGNTIYIASTLLGPAERQIEIGDSVVGTKGGSSNVTAWHESASDVKIYNARSYGNGRDDLASGNPYAGLKLNLAGNAEVLNCDFNDPSGESIQDYGIYAVNSRFNYSQVAANSSLIQPIFETGKTGRLERSNPAETASALAFSRGGNATLDVNGEISISEAAWTRIVPSSGNIGTLTDITGDVIDGTVLVLSTAASSHVVTIEENSRLRVGGPIVLRSISDRLVLMYNDSGSGHWALLSNGVRNSLEVKSASEIVVANDAAEKVLMSLPVPANALGRLCFSLAGALTNGSGSSIRATFRIKLGDTTFWEGTTADITTGAQIRATLLEGAIVGSGARSQKLNGNLLIGANNHSAAAATDEINTNAVIREQASEDEAAALQFQLTIQLSAADEGVQFVLDQSYLEVK